MKRLIKDLLNRLINVSVFVGFYPTFLFKLLGGRPFYYSDLEMLEQQKGDDTTFYFGTQRLILDERFSESGTMSGHYFHQDLYVASRIFKNNPKLHVDIGSRTDGFVAHVAVFREIEIFDIREQKSKVKNIIFRKADLLELPEGMVNYCDSISSLHAIEHFGLGRYGDPIDYFGHLKAIENVTKILKTGGTFYISVPIGAQRIEFNAHRVFSVQYLLDLFKYNFTLQRFSYIDQHGDFHENVELIQTQIDTNYNCNYGCGIFELIKI